MQPAFRPRRIALLLPIVALVLLSAGCAAHAGPSGGAGHPLLHTLKVGSGTPAVVFEAGLGEGHGTWAAVQATVARSTATFSYDRAGLGSSRPGDGRRDAVRLAAELHEELARSGVPGPYILVGHSLGAWIVTVFAHTYPGEVAGLVLVDPAYHEPRLRAAMSAESWAERERALARYGGEMTLHQQREKDALEASGEQALAAISLPAVPAVLLSATRISSDFPAAALEREVKLQMHREWVSTLPGTEHVVTEGSRHYIQQDEPALVIGAIARVLARSSASGPRIE